MKSVCISLLICCSSFCFGQVKKGAVPVGGSVSAYYYSNEFGDSYSQSRIIPKVGYYFRLNTAFGVSVSYSYSRTKRTADSTKITVNASEIAFSPYLRRDFSVDETKGIFCEASASVGYNDYDYNSDKILSFSVSLRPGIYWFVTKNLSLEATIGLLQYRREIVDYDHAANGYRDIVVANFSATNIDFGLQYYFRNH